MNGVSNSMMGTATQAIQSNPMLLIQQMLDKFEQEKLANQQASQQRTAQYQQSQEQRGAELKTAGEKYAEPTKMGTGDYALTIASLALPLIGALLPQGRGRRGQRAKASKQQALTGLGKGLGQVGGLISGRKETKKEREYAAALKGIEHLSGLADMIYAGEGKQAATQMGAAGKEAELGMRGMGTAAQLIKAGQPKPEKPPFTPTQLYQQGRNAAADARREQTQTQKDTLVKANQITRSIFGMEFVINSIQDLDEAIYSIENHKVQPSKVGLGQAYPPSLTVLPQLKQLRDQYYGGETPMLPMGEGQGGGQPSLEEIEAELARRQVGGRP